MTVKPEYTVAIVATNDRYWIEADGKLVERCDDTVMIYRNGEEVGTVTVHSSPDRADYDAALHRAGYRNWEWKDVTDL